MSPLILDNPINLYLLQIRLLSCYLLNPNSLIVPKNIPIRRPWLLPPRNIIQPIFRLLVDYIILRVIWKFFQLCTELGLYFLLEWVWIDLTVQTLVEPITKLIELFHLFVINLFLNPQLAFNLFILQWKFILLKLFPSLWNSPRYFLTICIILF